MWERSVRRLMHAVRDMRVRRAFAYLVLVTFVLQGFVTQSHMHFGAPAQKAAAGTHQSASGAVLGATQKSPGQQSPGGRDDGNCPICHAASIAGAAFASAAPMLRIPSLSSLVPYVDERSILVERFTAAWRSRAPPAH